MLRNMFKKVSRTFEAGVLKIFKNIQPVLQIRRSYIKSSVFNYDNLRQSGRAFHEFTIQTQRVCNKFKADLVEAASSCGLDRNR